jgi:hypothetical protein
MHVDNQGAAPAPILPAVGSKKSWICCMVIIVEEVFDASLLGPADRRCRSTSLAYCALMIASEGTNGTGGGGATGGG